ncbi:hypothetical protein DENSPDRAFT_209580 [Dentipellis sp. KUC8613]|nr:hypothetical protein DENSPDRAFT_209580 [Dentipellis sp. KUC8613]
MHGTVSSAMILQIVFMASCPSPLCRHLPKRAPSHLTRATTSFWCSPRTTAPYIRCRCECMPCRYSIGVIAVRVCKTEHDRRWHDVTQTLR